MSVRLVSLQFLPRDDGWSSPKYRFGRVTTVVTGDNGSGKTPLLRGLALALGAKLELPQLITMKCRAVRVVLDKAGTRITVERSFAQNYATLEENGRQTRCTSEQDISRELLAHLGIAPRSLVRRNDSQPVRPYVSVLAPIFYVDQDHGWKDLYEAPPSANFVQDQREEALRWILDIPQRNSASTRQERDEARRKYAALFEEVEVKKRVVESLRRQVGDDAREGVRQQLQDRRAALTERLNSLIQSFDGLAKVDAAIEADIRQAAMDRDSARERVDSLKRQASNLTQTRDELARETSMLEANEIAANVFREFCGKEDCNLFRPQDSYGRRLLHLRDQLKDVDATSKLLAKQIAQAQRALADKQAVLDRHVARRRAATSSSGGDTLAAEIESLTKQLAQLSVRLDRLETLNAQLQKLVRLSEKLQKASDEMTALANTRSSPGGQRLADARTILATSTEKWLRALRARNLGNEVRFDTNLVPTIGGERFSASSSQSGSTRTRIVLALHAALVETSIEMGGQHPGFLILDAPKQQELDRKDLAAFVTACEALFSAQKPPFQLVVGAKERDIFTSSPSAVWEPTFRSDRGYHYLG